MNKKIAWIMVLLLTLTSAGSYAVPSTVATNIATELQDIYSYLELAEAQDIESASAALQVQMTGPWLLALNPLLTVEAVAKFPDEATAKMKIQEFVLGMTQVYLNTQSETMSTDIDGFIGDQNASDSAFVELFGDPTYLTDLLRLLYETEVNITGSLDGAEKLSLATAGSDESLITAMEAVVSDAVMEEIATNPAYSHLSGMLGSVDWDIATLMAVQNAVLDGVPTGTAARVAIANATVRSEAAVASGDLTPTVGDTVTYSVSFFGQETNLFELSSPSALVSVSGRQVTAVGAGTATIYVHRIGGSTALADYDYIHTFDITIAAASSGGGSVPVPTPEPEEEPGTVEETNDNVNELGDTAGDVADETGANEVMDTAEAIAEDLANLAGTVETEEETQQLIENVVAITEAVSQVAENVLTEEGAIEALDSQTGIVGSVAAVLEVITDPAEQEAIVESTQNILEASDDLIGLMSDPVAAEAVATDLIEAAAPLLEAVSGSETLSESLSETLGAIAQSYVEVASTALVDSADTVLSGSVAMITLDNEQILQMATQSSEAIATMNSALASGSIESPRALQVVVTLTVPAVEGAQEYESLLPTPQALAGVVDHVSIQTPVATIQVGADVLEGQSASLIVSAGLVEPSAMTPAESGRAAGRTVFDFNISSGGEEINTFTQPLLIRVPVQLAAGEDPAAMTMFNLLPSGEAVPMGGQYANGIMTYRAPHTSRYFVASARETFGDVPPGHWAKDYIELLAGKGIISGKTENVFDPNAPITRAEFTVLLMKAMAYSGSVDMLSFVDVSSKDWFAAYVAAAYQNGIVGGKGAGVFAPYDSITREEMAKMIANVLVKEDYTLSTKLPTGFSDYLSISPWAIREVRTAVREGIISGLPNGTFMPKANATRAEAATMVYQLFVK